MQDSKISVMIADDEENIRAGLKCIMDWDDLGFSVDYEAENGEQALDIIEKSSPEVVVMDLNMPRIQGIDVIKKAREKGYPGRFIILSGYSDFKYAQSAIKYGVTNYLTKPVDEDELQKTLEDIGRDLSLEKEEEGKLQNIRKKARDSVIQDLLRSNELDLSIEELGKMKLMYDKYQVVVYETYHTNRQRPEYKLPELLSAFIDTGEYESCIMNERAVILLKGKAAISRFRKFLDHYDKRPIQEDSPLDAIFLTYGRCVDKACDIKISCDEAMKLSDRRFFGDMGVHKMGYEELAVLSSQNKSVITKDILRDYTQKIIGFMQAGSIDRALETLNEMKACLCASNENSTAIRIYMTDMILEIKNQISRIYQESGDIFAENSEIIDFLETRFYLYEIFEYIQDIAFKVVQMVRGRQGARSTMEDAAAYVDHNYFKNLTLEVVAPLFGYNNVYFGKVFSKEIGVSFNTYLNKKRIEEAKKLLTSSDIKIYDIAERVGYSDVDYFGRKFRSMEGISPADYRKKAKVK
ncbi:two-component system, response regulator YesN [Butyrivibrio fibrisolvens]|uniref:Stage 0 sporulation protein A homolog n=1 Tax=Butyrivibrio fibrisolvens TaxID=831 RepID=A0A1H9TJB9_BUTFI|nr:response regulator [Butyrivibrio fibrisolvens]SER97251.1 two-component system, response regulator YesN [Butyrivibrio fibrisolvens]